jgi:TP901 family phage tail tape measure protein
MGTKLSIGLTLPIVGIGVAAGKMALDFDAAMTKIVSLVGISSDEVAGMRDSVLKLSSATGKSATELADALFVVTSAGLRGESALKALDASAKASASGLGETADIARSVAGALNAYGPAMLDAGRATDIIVATARAGNFETSQFAAALGRVLPFAKQAGASLEEVGGAVALLTRTNGDAAQSVTQISALMRAFVVPTEEAKKALADAGLSASDMRDRIGRDGLASALQFLDRELGGNREQLGKLLGSSEAAGAAFQILDADSKTLAETFGVVTDSVGMTEDAFNTTSKTAGFKMQQAFNDLKVSHPPKRSHPPG